MALQTRGLSGHGIALFAGGAATAMIAARVRFAGNVQREMALVL